MTELRDGVPPDSYFLIPEDRREAPRHDATIRPTRMSARVGGSEVRLLDISRRGVMLETDSRLPFGVKATIRFTTTDASVCVRALVVRSRVARLGEVVVFHTALTFDEELRLADALAQPQPKPRPPVKEPGAPETEPFARDGSTTDDNGEILLNDALNLLVTVSHDLEELQRRADAHGDD